MGCSEPESDKSYLGNWEVDSLNGKPFQDTLNIQLNENNSTIQIIRNEWYFGEDGTWLWYLDFRTTTPSHRFLLKYVVGGTFYFGNPTIANVNASNSFNTSGAAENLFGAVGADDTAMTLTKSIANGNVDIVDVSDTGEDTSALENIANAELEQKLQAFLFIDEVKFHWEVVDNILTLTDSDLEIVLRSIETGVLPIK